MSTAPLDKNYRVGPVTRDRILGGKVSILQPKQGYRVAIDPVLLAAAVPVQPGHKVLDVGVGTGAVSLCLAARTQGLRITGVDCHGPFLELAAENARENGVDLSLVQGDVLGLPENALAAEKLGPFDHVVTNPPFWSQGSGRSSDIEASAVAAMLPDGGLKAWIAFCLDRLGSAGTFSAIIPFRRLGDVLSVLRECRRDTIVLPLIPKAQREPKRVIIQSRIAHVSGDDRLDAIVLHKADGTYTDQVDSVLRGEAAFSLI